MQSSSPVTSLSPVVSIWEHRSDAMHKAQLGVLFLLLPLICVCFSPGAIWSSNGDLRVAVSPGQLHTQPFMGPQ
jgi:hypothetical protein